MSENKMSDVDLQIVIGIMRLSELADDKLIAERISTLFRLSVQIKTYQKEFANTPLALDICAKKIEFIFNAKSKSELEEILSPPKVRYNFSEIVPVGRFHVEEEELLIWSRTSLWCGAPLCDAGFKRYIKLFKKFFPDLAEQIGIT